MKSKNMRNVILMFIDMFVVAISAMLALALRFDILNIPIGYLETAIRCLPADIVIDVSI